MEKMSERNRILIFIGKPGSGKSTLIKKLPCIGQNFDIKPHVQALKVNGRVPEDKTLDAYKKLYRLITDLKGQDIVLELGTNHPELNIKKFTELRQKYSLQIFLCHASVETCRARAKARPEEFDTQALERRLARDFPNSHVKLLESAGLAYEILDMEQPIEKTAEALKNKYFNNVPKKSTIEK